MGLKNEGIEPVILDGDTDDDIEVSFGEKKTAYDGVSAIKMKLELLPPVPTSGKFPPLRIREDSSESKRSRNTTKALATDDANALFRPFYSGELNKVRVLYRDCTAHVR